MNARMMPVALALVCITPIRAEEPVPAPVVEAIVVPVVAAVVAVATPVRDFGWMLWDDLRLTLRAPLDWERGDWLSVGVGSAVVLGTALTLDRAVDRTVKKNESKTMNRVADFVAPFGQDYSFGVLGAFYLAGSLVGDTKMKNVAGDGLAASLVAVVLFTPELKLITGRSRPDDERGEFHFSPFRGDASFPSGHTLQAFAIGSVIAEHYEQPWVDVVSYGMATAVGLSRIYRREHHLSDVVAGALIGTGIGQFVVRTNKARRAGVAVMPMVWEESYGLALGAEF